jgi:hypothetical protein
MQNAKIKFAGVFVSLRLSEFKCKIMNYYQELKWGLV